MPEIIDTIRQAFVAGQIKPVKVTDLDQVPSGYNAITPEWLTKVMCRDTAGAVVTALRLDEPDNGSSNRMRIFLQYNGAGVAAGLPPTVFCKAAEQLDSRIVLGVSGTAQAEANFYNLVRNRLTIDTPHAYHAAFDPQTFAYIIVMEDMAERCTFFDERTEVSWEQAVSQVRTLAGLHARFYESPELGTASLPFKRWPDWWDAMMKGAPQYSACCDRAFGDAEAMIPPRLFRRRAEVWPCTERSAARHSVLPNTLIHSDVHLKNWFMTPDNGMGLSDWQLTTIGHWSRDYAFATTTTLTIEQRRRWDSELLRIYLDQLAEQGVPRTNAADAMHNIRQQLFSALSFWTITLRPTVDMPAMQPEHTTYELIRRMSTAINDYDALDSFDD